MMMRGSLELDRALRVGLDQRRARAASGAEKLSALVGGFGALAFSFGALRSGGNHLAFLVTPAQPGVVLAPQMRRAITSRPARRW